MNTFIIVLSILILLYIVGIISKKKRAKAKVISIIEDNCTGCQRCIKKCRRKALEVLNDDNGRHVVLKYPERCTACRDCVIACKFNAMKLVDRIK